MSGTAIWARRKRVGSVIVTGPTGGSAPGTDSGFARSMRKKTSRHQATLRAGSWDGDCMALAAD